MSPLFRACGLALALLAGGSEWLFTHCTTDVDCASIAVSWPDGTEGEEPR